MFEKKFKEEISNIKATDESKATLLEKIEKEQAKKREIGLKPVKKRWVSAIAAAVTLVIVSVSAFGLPPFTKSNNTNQVTSNEETVEKPKVEATENINGYEFPVVERAEGIPASVTHNQIYTLFSSIYEVEQTRTYTDDLIIEDGFDIGLATGDTKAPSKNNSNNAIKDENGSAKPGNTVTEETTDSEDDFSETNTQVENVDEADIVKTDGKYIYTLNVKDLEINITSAKNGKLTNVANFDVFSEGLDENKFYRKYYGIADMYLCDERIVVVCEKYSADKNREDTIVQIFDVSNPSKPTEVGEFSQSGAYLSSRIIDGKLYIFSNEYIYEKPTRDDVNSYIPCTAVDGGIPTPVKEGSIYMFDGEVTRSFLTASSIKVSDGKVIDTKTALGGGETLYANTNGFYLTADVSNIHYLTKGFTSSEYEDKTRIMHFAIEDGKITAMAEGTVKGRPLNQFSMDEYNDHFRIVTTSYEDYTTVNSVYVLDKELKVVGKITDIAKGERVYSVRFMGDVGYFVTFRETDPLFAVDLKDPKNPKILSALKIPGFSNYMHPWGEGLLLGIGADANEKTGIVRGIKLSMFDTSDPTKVFEKNKEIIDISDSTVGTNHKGILADYNKNLIGFCSRSGKYYLYSYSKENGFKVKGVLETQRTLDSQGNYDDFYYYDYNSVRGIYIGDYFYVCSPAGINSYKLSDLSNADSLMFI